MKYETSDVNDSYTPFRRYSRLSNGFDNRFDNGFDNRLYRVNGALYIGSLCMIVTVFALLGVWGP